ncbi:hypothetical protein [Acaryochloris sp. IP29b_bin.148]|uniref:hypothetical protein n=1 Tax=Acaryochloris sp. IP29b_bin.148 TaxID=2969218 RepID=UPI00261887A1|nr:hypothetical protein [Acaryochloris sp. IP29b_bin.148]
MQAANNMQESASPSGGINLIDTLTVCAAIGGGVASLVTQQIAFASIPLSLTAILNLTNRRQQIAAVQEQQRMENAHLIRRCQDEAHAEIVVLKQSSEGVHAQIEHLTQQKTQALQTIATLTEQTDELKSVLTTLKQSQQQGEVTFKTLNEQNQTSQTQVEKLSTDMEDLKNAIAYLQSSASDLDSRVDAQQNNSQHLAAQTESVEELVEILREIDTLTQAISANPAIADHFYQRGLIRKQLQRLEDHRIAMEDFSQAIQLEPTLANAYFERGLLKSDFDHKQHAVDDLRTAAKLYFEQGDLTQYEKARDLSQNIHDLISGDPSPEEETEQYLIENLFG